MAVACSAVDMPQTSLGWYALRVRSNFEWAVNAALAGKDYESFLPTYRTRRRWSDRTKEIDTPLFRGYTFCRFDPLQRLPILTTPGEVSGVMQVNVQIPANALTGPLPIVITLTDPTTGLSYSSQAQVTVSVQ